MRRRKEVAQGSEFPSWRTFARLCRRMPGGCGGKMARQARQRLCRRMPGGCGGKMARQARQRLKAVRAQQNKSVQKKVLVGYLLKKI